VQDAELHLRLFETGSQQCGTFACLVPIFEIYPMHTLAQSAEYHAHAGLRFTRLDKGTPSLNASRR